MWKIYEFLGLQSYVHYNGHALMYESTCNGIIYDNVTEVVNSINLPENNKRLT